MLQKPFFQSENGSITIPHFSTSVRQCLDLAADCFFSSAFSQLLEKTNGARTKDNLPSLQTSLCIGRPPLYFDQHSWLRIKNLGSLVPFIDVDPALQVISADGSYYAQHEMVSPSSVVTNRQSDAPFFTFDDVGQVINTRSGKKVLHGKNVLIGMLGGRNKYAVSLGFVREETGGYVNTSGNSVYPELFSCISLKHPNGSQESFCLIREDEQDRLLVNSSEMLSDTDPVSDEDIAQVRKLLYDMKDLKFMRG